jgi:hypothetical protein
VIVVSRISDFVRALDAPWCRPASTSKIEAVPDDHAYESGYASGLVLNREPNPHSVGSIEHEGYARGYADGAEARGVPPGDRLLGGPSRRMLYRWEIAILRDDLKRSLARPLPDLSITGSRNS